jgi:adenylylsulfate kinase-like enzyme
MEKVIGRKKEDRNEQYRTGGMVSSADMRQVAVMLHTPFITPAREKEKRNRLMSDAGRLTPKRNLADTV